MNKTGGGGKTSRNNPKSIYSDEGEESRDRLDRDKIPAKVA